MGSTTSYASAVAAVKAMESALLSYSDMEQLISAATDTEFNAIISARRGSDASAGSELADAWEVVHGYAPDCRELEMLLYKYDFHNLKAALKAMIADCEPEPYYIRPTNLDLGELSPILKAKDYDLLPLYLRETAEKAYQLLTDTLDGQLADSFIDTATLTVLQDSAEKSGNEFLKNYARITAVCADIKTAYRCSRMNKPRSFLEIAIAGSADLDKEALIRAALTGTDGLFNFLDTTIYGEKARLLESSTAAFEKWCDDEVMEIARSARLQAFGFEPLAAYYIAARAEQKNLRIIRVCKECGADRETITERLRLLYV